MFTQSTKAMNQKPVALVTGASSGFGRLTASLLAETGYRVFGTSRKQHAAAPLDVEMLMLDVRSDQSIRACLEQLLAVAARIDLLVNNAGQAHASVIEETRLEHARDIFETNFWGVVRLTNAVLPVMRRQCSGRIINVGSLAGLVGIPGHGYYCASKFALEGYSEALNLEVDPFNIKVSVIEPGFFRTNLHQAMTHGDRLLDEYNAVRSSVETTFRDGVAHGGDPRKVAELIVRVAQNRSPRLHYRVGSNALWVPYLKALLPDKLFRFGLRKRFNL